MSSRSGADWPSVTLREHRMQVAGHPVPYRTAGEGEPVVVVHGLGGSSRCWAWAVPALATRYRVFLVDLPGFGRLRRLHRELSLDTASRWLQEWMRAADVGHAHLIGHSMGAFISTQMAAAVAAPSTRGTSADDHAARPVQSGVTGVPRRRASRRVTAGSDSVAAAEWRLPRRSHRR